MLQGALQNAKISRISSKLFKIQIQFNALIASYSKSSSEIA